MLSRHLSPTAKVTAAGAAAALILLSSMSYAANGHRSRVYVDENGYGGGRSSGSYTVYPNSTPDDYVSSDVCRNGYRWITRQFNRTDSPEQNAIPVPC